MPDTSMRLSKEHARELELLRLAWGMKTLDEVLERIIAPHRLEKLKALGIRIEEEKQ